MARSPDRFVLVDLTGQDSAGQTQSAPPAEHFLQSSFWADFKSAQGWGNRQCIVRDTVQGTSTALSVLTRHFRFFGTLAYIPMGPAGTQGLSNPERMKLLRAVGKGLAQHLKPRPFYVRFDPPWYACDPDFPPAPTTGLHRAAGDIQPPDTVLINLEKDEQSLLEAMKPKWRYNIKLAEKKGVTVRRLTGDEALDSLDVFYDLYRITGVRDGIALHDRSYYHELFKRAGTESGIQLNLYLADHEDQSIAAIVVLHHRSEAVYLYGASADHKRNLMAPYALQWQAIRDAQRSGALVYDMYGIPPNDDPGHPMHGLWRFKTGFGGTVIHRPGSIDYPVCVFRYTLWRLAEILRLVWYKKIKKALKRPSRNRQHRAETSES